MTEQKIRKVITCFLELYKTNPNRWVNERYAHYDFFKLLFDYFEPAEIKNNFKWEYPVGVPSYGAGSKEATIDMVFTIDNEKWIAIEIELVGAGKEFEVELTKCVEKLKTAPECRKHMSIGFIIPLIVRKKRKIARGYCKSYEDLFREIINEVKNKIGEYPIELITGGVILL
jgi:phage anti-repressor protein